jgi:hypothetical protein
MGGVKKKGRRERGIRRRCGSPWDPEEAGRLYKEWNGWKYKGGRRERESARERKSTGSIRTDSVVYGTCSLSFSLELLE